MWEGVTRLRREGDRHEIPVVGTRSTLTVTIAGLEAGGLLQEKGGVKLGQVDLGRGRQEKEQVGAAGRDGTKGPDHPVTGQACPSRWADALTWVPGECARVLMRGKEVPGHGGRGSKSRGPAGAVRVWSEGAHVCPSKG